MNKEDYNEICQLIEDIYLGVGNLEVAHHQTTERILGMIHTLRNKVDAQLESTWLPLPAGFKEENDRIHANDPKPKKFNARVSHTFQDWSDAGYRINKGSKATGRDETGKATFKPSQVTLSGDIIIATYGTGDDRDRDDFPPFDESECF
jgi:hypothetical protein